MSEMLKIQATLVSLACKGVLICGKSGSGKSDLALRLLENKAARLVADDVVLLSVHNGRLCGRAPDTLSGLLEVRGIGIVRYDCLEESPVNLVVRLTDNPQNVERLPEEQWENLSGVTVPAMDLWAKELSACEKIIVKLRDNLLKAE